jgi:hypothetical protein
MEFVYFVWISEKIINFTLQNIKILVLITEVESVYCALRKVSLYNTDEFKIEDSKFLKKVCIGF